MVLIAVSTALDREREFRRKRRPGRIGRRRGEAGGGIGRAPDQVQRLGAWYPTPGYCDEELIFFRLACGSRPPIPYKPDDDEDIRSRPMTVADAKAR